MLRHHGPCELPQFSTLHLIPSWELLSDFLVASSAFLNTDAEAHEGETDRSRQPLGSVRFPASLLRLVDGLTAISCAHLPLKTCISEAHFHVWTWAACPPVPTALQWSGTGTAPDLLSHYRIAVSGWRPAPGYPSQCRCCLLWVVFPLTGSCFAGPMFPGDSLSSLKAEAACSWGFCFLLTSHRGTEARKELCKETSQTPQAQLSTG